MRLSPCFSEIEPAESLIGSSGSIGDANLQNFVLDSRYMLLFCVPLLVKENKRARDVSIVLVFTSPPVQPATGLCIWLVLTVVYFATGAMFG